MASFSHQQWRRIGGGVCLVVGGFLLAHTLNAFVADALYLSPAHSANPIRHDGALPVTYSPMQAAEEVRGSGLFLLPAAPAGPAPASAGASMPVRGVLGLASKIRLIGVVFNDQRGVYAIIEDVGTKKQGLYKLFDVIQDIGELSEIRRDAIVVRRGDIEELLELVANDKPIAAVPIASSSSTVQGMPLRKVIDRREVEQAMNDLPKLLSQARAVPYMSNGAISGFRIDYVAPASFYEKIGIQYGDVLQQVNGVDVRDPSTMLTLFQQLKNERTVKLDLVRNNQRTTMTYELR